MRRYILETPDTEDLGIGPLDSGALSYAQITKIGAGGVPGTIKNFTDNGDGTVTDRDTGLMWVADPSRCGISWGMPGTPLAMDITTASIATAGLNYAGYTDWRLPDVNELSTLVDYSRTSPSLSPTFFPNVQANKYWAGTPWAGMAGNFWTVDFDSGWTDYDFQPNTNFIRPVRNA